MSSALGFPDWQRITQWFGAVLAQATGAPIGAGQIVEGPLNVRSFASIVVWVKPTGGTVTVTVTQSVAGGPAALQSQSSFVVNAGNVIAEAFVLLAGVATVTFQGSAPGETLDYAIVPANTNVNAEVAALTQLGFQHNDAVIANETAIDLEDAAPIGWTFVDDPANLRMKITPTFRQNGAATGSLYRWAGAAWAPTANVLVDDTAMSVTFGGDTIVRRLAAGEAKTDGKFRAGSRIIANDGLAQQIDLDNDGRIYFSNLTDTYLLRRAAGSAGASGGFDAGGRVIANLGLAQQIDLDNDGRIYFSNLADTYVGRAGAGVAETNGIFKGDLETTGASVMTARAGGAAAALPANPVRYLAMRDDSGVRVYVPCYT